jgi:hypothetical protein
VEQFIVVIAAAEVTTGEGAIRERNILPKTLIHMLLDEKPSMPNIARTHLARVATAKNQDITLARAMSK